MCCELRQISQGYEDIKGTNTIFFMSQEQIKQNHDRSATLTKSVSPWVAIWLTTHIWTNYPYSWPYNHQDFLWNRLLTTPNAEYIFIEIKNFYLETPLDWYKYMKTNLVNVLTEFICLYNLQDKFKNGFLYMEIKMGMYGLPQHSNSSVMIPVVLQFYYESDTNPCRPM